MEDLVQNLEENEFHTRACALGVNSLQSRIYRSSSYKTHGYYFSMVPQLQVSLEIAKFQLHKRVPGLGA